MLINNINNNLFSLKYTGSHSFVLKLWLIDVSVPFNLMGSKLPTHFNWSYFWTMQYFYTCLPFSSQEGLTSQHERGSGCVFGGRGLPSEAGGCGLPRTASLGRGGVCIWCGMGQPPSPTTGKIGQYTYYWNAFLLKFMRLTLIVPCVTIVLLPVFRRIDTLFFFAWPCTVPVTAHNIKMYPHFNTSNPSKLQLLCFIKQPHPITAADNNS